LKLKRCCVICRTKDDKSNLFRIVSNDTVALLDEKQNINSRGIYICKNTKCINNLIKAISKNKFNFKIDINKDSLKNVLELLIIRMGE